MHSPTSPGHTPDPPSTRILSTTATTERNIERIACLSSTKIAGSEAHASRGFPPFGGVFSKPAFSVCVSPLRRGPGTVRGSRLSRLRYPLMEARLAALAKKARPASFHASHALHASTRVHGSTARCDPDVTRLSTTRGRAEERNATDTAHGSNRPWSQPALGKSSTRITPDFRCLFLP